MTAADLALAVLRTTLATSAAACLAAILLAVLRVDSPRTHRVVWLLVVLQGWLLFPFTLELTAPQTVEEPPALGAMPSSAWAWTESDFVTELPQIAEPEPAAPQMTATQLAIAAWLTGATLLTLFAATRYLRIVRALPLGAPPDDPQWREEWTASLGAMAMSAWPCLQSTSKHNVSIHFRITKALGPLVAYIPFAYILLAPRPLWTTLTPAERTAILRHELAHIRRRDLWKSLVIRLLALPQWFNPLVWRAVRRFDEAAEWSCDASACAPAARGLAPQHTALASALLRTAELTSPQRSVGAVGFISAVPPNAKTNRGHSSLQRRIHRLVTPRFKEESAMRKLAVPALLVALAAAQLIRIERVAAQDPPPSQGGVRGGIPAATSDPAEAGRSADAEVPTGLPLTSDDPPSSPADPAPLKRRPYDEQAWPRYIIEPPDMLQLSGVKLIPKGPHKIDAFDVIRVRIATKLPEGPIDDTYAVDADGTINLGWTYGRVRVVGMTIEEVEAELRSQISNNIKRTVEVSASLIATAGAQQIDGQHLVAMDGRINLGVYGSVYVAGMTIEEARTAIEKKLSEHLEAPQVAVDVHAYNSKVYYVITKGGDKGDDVVRAPITGNDTVLDAIAGVGGGVRSADVKIWISRPAPNGVRNEQILQVVWNDIASGKSDDTNYTLHPGDRLFVDEPRYREPTADEEKPTSPYAEAVRPSPPEGPHPLAADSLEAAPEMPAARVAELKVHDIVTVLMDPPREDGLRPASFRILCEIKEIRPNGNLYIEGRAAIANVGPWPELSLSGEVRREEVRPDGTVSSRSIVNLKVDKREVSAQAESPTITIVLRQNGGEQLLPLAFQERMTVGDALRDAVYPNPIDFGAAAIVLERVVRRGARSQTVSQGPIPWDESQTRPAFGYDWRLELGDRILIDLSQGRPASEASLPPTAQLTQPSEPDLAPTQTTNEAQPRRSQNRYPGSENGALLFERAADTQTAVQPPRPVHPAPAPPFAQQVMFKLSVIRDRAGDVAELGDSLREDGAATGDTESMLGVLRIMRKHKLVEVVADPTIVTVLGRPASMALDPKALGDDSGMTVIPGLAVTVSPASAKDGVLRLEAGMSLGETRIDRGFDLPLGETLVLAAPPHDKAGAGKLYLVVTPELVDAPQPQPQP